jgi:hypothetical protein
MLTDGLLALWGQISPAGQEILLYVSALLGRHLRQDGLTLAQDVTLIGREAVPMLQIRSNLSLPLGSHIPKRCIVLHEAFLLIRGHTLQILDPFRRQPSHLISSALIISIGVVACICVVPGATGRIVWLRPGLGIRVALGLWRISFVLRGRGWRSAASTLRIDRRGDRTHQEQHCEETSELAEALNHPSINFAVRLIHLQKVRVTTLPNNIARENPSHSSVLFPSL